MSLQDEIVERYLQEHSSPEPPSLRHLQREAHVHLLQPRMLSGHLQGRLLKMLVSLVNPRNVLELGTYTGYASLALAEGLTLPQATVHTIEQNDEMEPFIRRALADSPWGSRVVLHIGDALQILPTLLQQVVFDLVYIDADKRQYTAYYEHILPHLPSGALLLADNTLWDGKVLQYPAPHDAQTQGIMSFNDQVATDPQVEVVMLPLRDGLSLIRKR